MKLHMIRKLERTTNVSDIETSVNECGCSGYMSPEYAMQGLFSEKSDVFSFGVLLLEIISGERNGIFSDDDDEQSLTLLGYVSTPIFQEFMLYILLVELMNYSLSNYPS